jgi:hypothetical protein
MTCCAEVAWELDGYRYFCAVYYYVCIYLIIFSSSSSSSSITHDYSLIGLFAHPALQYGPVYLLFAFVYYYYCDYLLQNC